MPELEEQAEDDAEGIWLNGFHSLCKGEKGELELEELSVCKREQEWTRPAVACASSPCYTLRVLRF